MGEGGGGSLEAEILGGLGEELANKRGGDSQEGRALALAAASSSPTVVAETERQKCEAEERLKESEEKLTELQQRQRNIKPRLSAREVLNQAARFAIKDEDLRKQAQEVAEEIGISKEIATLAEIRTPILQLDNIWTEIVFTMRNNKSL